MWEILIALLDGRTIAFVAESHGWAIQQARMTLADGYFERTPDGDEVWWPASQVRRVTVRRRTLPEEGADVRRIGA